jgi:hypothetical protein
MKISDKLSKVDEDMSIRMYDNGFLFEIQGRDENDDWATLKVVCATLDDVTTLVKEATQMERS